MQHSQLGSVAIWTVAAIILPLAAMGLFSWFTATNQFPVNGRTVVITGGSQGMGKGLAIHLSSKGASIVIVARDQRKLTSALEEIKAVASSPDTQRFHTISADLTSAEANNRIIKEVTEWNHGSPPDIVWANAGSSSPQLFLDASIDTLRSQMDVNYWAAVYLAQATLRAWTSPPAGGKAAATAKPAKELPARHFVITSSSVAFVGVAGYSPYAPCKSALRSLHDTLRSELNLYNAARDVATTPAIVNSIIFPGTILSPGYEHENQSKHAVTKILEEGDPAQTEQQVAETAVRELEKGRRFATTQFLASVMRASAMGGTPRDRVVVDTVLGWVTSLVWPFVSADMESKVAKWGRQNGLPKHGGA